MSARAESPVRDRWHRGDMLLFGLFLICLCQLAGQVLVTATGLPAPGTVVGMALLLLVLLVWRPRREPALMRAGDVLLAKLSLFFVPAGVGVISYLATVRESPVAVLLGLLVPWFVTLVVAAGTAWSVLRLGLTVQERRARRRHAGTRP